MRIDTISDIVVVATADAPIIIVMIILISACTMDFVVILFKRTTL